MVYAECCKGMLPYSVGASKRAFYVSVKRIIPYLFLVLIYRIRTGIISSVCFRFLICNTYRSITKDRTRPIIVFLRRLFAIQRSRCSSMSARNFHSRVNQVTFYQVRRYDKVRLRRLRALCHSLNPMRRNGAITNNCIKIYYHNMCNSYSSNNRRNRFKGRDIGLSNI